MIMFSNQSIVILSFLFLAAGAQANDLGFRYRNGRCLNGANAEGLNPSFIGQCSDLRNAVLGRLDFTQVDFSGSKFTNADLQQSKFDGANLTGVDFEAANLSGVSFGASTLKN